MDELVVLALVAQGIVLALGVVLLAFTLRATTRARKYARQAHYSATQRLYRNELYGASGKMLRYDEKETRGRRKRHRPHHARKR